MNRIRLLSITVFIVLLLFSFSCIKINEVATDDWNAAFALPLLHTTVNMEDFLDSLQQEGQVDIDEDQFITLNYTDFIFSESASNIFSLQPSFGFPILDTAITVDIDDIGLNDFPDFTRLKTGQLQIDFSSNEIADLDVELQILNLQLDGEPFVYQFTIPFDGAPPSNFQTTIDLAGYALDFSSDLEVRYIAFNGLGERVWLIGDFPNLNFINLDYSYVEGSFQPINFDLPLDSFELNFFETDFEGMIDLANPQLSFRFRNSVGIPLMVRAQELKAETQQAGRIDFVSPLDNGYTIQFPSVAGLNVVDTLTFNVDNSNIDEVVNAFPNKVIYDLEGIGFPSGTQNIRGFITDTSSFDVELDIVLPLEGSVSQFSYETLTDVEENDLDIAKEVEFKLLSINDFPLEAGVQVFFEDADGKVLDKLFPNMGTIPAASRVNLAGRAVTPGEGELFATLNENKLDNIRDMQQIRVVITLNTRNDNTLVETKIFSDYELELKLGMRITPEN